MLETPAPDASACVAPSIETCGGIAGVADVAWSTPGAGVRPRGGCTVAWGDLVGHTPDSGAAGHPALLALAAAAVPESAAAGACLVLVRTHGADGPRARVCVLEDGGLVPSSEQVFDTDDEVAAHVAVEIEAGGIARIVASPEIAAAINAAGVPVADLDTSRIDPDRLPRFVAVPIPFLARRRPRNAALAGLATAAVAAGLFLAARDLFAPVPEPPRLFVEHIRPPAQFAAACAEALARADWPLAPGWELEVMGCHDALGGPVPELVALDLRTAAFMVLRRRADTPPGLALRVMDLVLGDLDRTAPSDFLSRYEGTDRLIAARAFEVPLVALGGTGAARTAEDGLSTLLVRTFGDLGTVTAGADPAIAGIPTVPQAGGATAQVEMRAPIGEALAAAGRVAGASLLSVRAESRTETVLVFGATVTRLQ